MIAAVELGLIYGLLALGVYLTFRILNFPDLTVDGSFTTGAAVAAQLILVGTHPLLATAAAFAAGLIAGLITGLLHTKGRINGLLAGILTMIGLWSINLRIMGGNANLQLLRETTVVTPLADLGLLRTWTSVAVFAAFVFAVKLLLDWFLRTDYGLAIRGTGDNEKMVRSHGVSTDLTKMLTLALSNGLVALCGSIIAQHRGSTDISMGVGLILVGLASVILGQAIFGSRTVGVSTFAVIMGAVLYQVVITLAMRAGFESGDMKLISALLVVVALLLPQWGIFRRLPSLRTISRTAAAPKTDGARRAREEAGV